jgi:hypothetical protein
MKKLIASGIIILILVIVASVGYGVASSTLPWPEGPLYSIDDADPSADLPEDRAEMMEIIAGHYAHYDVVSYEDLTTRSPMRTFIVSYGFTEFYVEDGQLYQADRFVHAEQILNQKNTISRFAGDSVQAIARRSTPVDLEFRDGAWRIYRPETPTLLGISGDPLQPLSRDRDDPALLDPDGDGNPGVTVSLNIAGFLDAEIYITRREIFRNHLTVYSPDLIQGHVEDISEQFVVGASHGFLDRPSNNQQHPDPGMNPLILRRVDPAIDSWEELRELREDLFPATPAFY